MLLKNPAIAGFFVNTTLNIMSKENLYSTAETEINNKVRSLSLTLASC